MAMSPEGNKTRKRRRRKPMTRSQMMGAVHSEDTLPEMVVRRGLFHAGFRYRLHRRDLPGTPDIFVQKYGVAVFVNGCFWHQHGCKLTSRPKSNATFWKEKFDSNVARDIRTLHQLTIMGIRVAVVWECSLKNPALTLECLENFIRGDEESIEL